MTNCRIGLSQAQQRRNHRHVMWVCRERVMRWAVGKMIAALEKMPGVSEVINLSRPHSYRGYYCDLAFELGEGTRPAWGLLAECKSGERGKKHIAVRRRTETTRGDWVAARGGDIELACESGWHPR